MNLTEKNKILQQLNSFSSNTLSETLEIEFIDLGDDYLVAQMPVSPKVHQYYGILHGGATAALLETVGSLASKVFIDTDKKIVKGIELNINHVSSKESGMIFATARSVHRGRTTHLWQVRVTDEHDKLISIGRITNIILDKKI